MLVIGKPGPEFSLGHRLRDEKALAIVARKFAKQIVGWLRFDPFGSHPEAEPVATLDHRRQEHATSRIRRGVISEERTIELQGIRRQIPQISNGALPRSEIVESNRDAELPQSGEVSRDLFQRPHQTAFGDLDFEFRRLNAVLPNKSGDPSRQVVVL